MLAIERCSVPPNTLLHNCVTNGAYVDCYSTEINGQVSFPDFIFAFYTTLLFKLERLVLKLTAAKPSTDDQARQLADGTTKTFAAWHVENRRDNEILMCDFLGRTRSWLMMIPVNTGNSTGTRLCFGSAVVPVRRSKMGKPSIGFGFQALLGFHIIYSMLLLYSAKSRVKSQALETENP